MVTTGPFSMAPGDTQDIIWAIVAGLGADRLSSITEMKAAASSVQSTYYNALLTGVGEENGQGSSKPNEWVLAQNYPNPFNPETKIQFTLSNTKRVLLKVYDFLGREIATLVDEERSAGVHTIAWNGKSQNGAPVSTGIYFYRLSVSGNSNVKKMLLMR